MVLVGVTGIEEHTIWVFNDVRQIPASYQYPSSMRPDEVSRYIPALYQYQPQVYTCHTYPGKNQYQYQTGTKVDTSPTLAWTGRLNSELWTKMSVELSSLSHLRSLGAKLVLNKKCLWNTTLLVVKASTHVEAFKSTWIIIIIIFGWRANQSGPFAK